LFTDWAARFFDRSGNYIVSGRTEWILMALYDAFISYSHAKDKPIAAALQSVVQKLGKPWYQRRALRVFRDDTSLSATPHLWPSIENALGESRFLMLLASPEAAASPWVEKEVSHWLERKGIDSLLIAVTAGDIAWDAAANDFAWREGTPLPAALKGRFAVEPKWVDLRPYRDGANAREARFIDLGANFAAAIRGVPKEDLLSQEVRQQRRALTLAWSAAGSLLVLAALAGWQWREATAQRDRAELNFAGGEDVLSFLGGQLARLAWMQGRNEASPKNVRAVLELAHVQLNKFYSDTTKRYVPLTKLAVQMCMQFSEALESLGDKEGAARFAKQGVDYLRGGEAVVYIPRPGCVACDIDFARSDPDRLTSLATALNRVGETLAMQSDLAGALAAYRESAVIARKLYATTPDKPEARRALLASLNGVGDLLRADWDRRDLVEALTVYQESAEIAGKMLLKDASDLSVRKRLAEAASRAGDLQRARRNAAGAVDSYREALHQARWIAKEETDNIGVDIQVALLLYKLAYVGDDPRGRLTEAVQILRRMKSQNRLPQSEQATLNEFETALAKLPRR
jgi:tetratricopeptide (TPR) repeat protein